MEVALEELRRRIHDMVDQLEAQTVRLRALQHSIEALRRSMMILSEQYARLAGADISPERLDLALEEWLGLTRFDVARRALIDALTQPIDGAPTAPA